MKVVHRSYRHGDQIMYKNITTGKLSTKLPEVVIIFILCKSILDYFIYTIVDVIILSFIYIDIGYHHLY